MREMVGRIRPPPPPPGWGGRGRPPSRTWAPKMDWVFREGCHAPTEHSRPKPPPFFLVVILDTFSKTAGYSETLYAPFWTRVLVRPKTSVMDEFWTVLDNA